MGECEDQSQTQAKCETEAAPGHGVLLKKKQTIKKPWQLVGDVCCVQTTAMNESVALSLSKSHSSIHCGNESQNVHIWAAEAEGELKQLLRAC